MAGKMLNLRLGQKLLAEIDFIVKHETYDTRTEFIKETLRKEVSEYNRNQLIESLKKKLGQGKSLKLKNISGKKAEQVREELGSQLLKEHGLI